MGKIAILGAAHAHVLHLGHAGREIKGAELIGLYDDDVQRCEASAGGLMVAAFPSAEELLKLKPDLVLIGAVPSERASLAEMALSAGCNVIIDKPLALDLPALNAVRAAQRKYNRAAIVFYPCRGIPHVVAAKHAVEKGRIGRLVRIFASGPHWLNSIPRPDWHWKRSTNGDLLVDIGSHYLDLCCWLTGRAPVDIHARFGNFAAPQYPEFRDFGFADMRFADGTVAYIEVDWLATAIASTRIAVQGSRGKIELSLGETTTAHIWTEMHSESLTPVEKTIDQWIVDLMSDALSGRTCAILQEDVWRASEVSLLASASAIAEEKRRGM